MVPEAAVLVVGNDNCRIGPGRAVLYLLHQIRYMLLTLQQGGIPWMLVVWAERFDERDSRQRVGLDLVVELRLVLQVLFAPVGAVGVVLEESEWLVVVLEQRVGMPVQRVSPAAREPGPRDALFAQPVADRRLRLLRDQLGCISDIRRMRRVDRKRGVDNITVGRDRAIFNHDAIRVELGDPAGRGIGPCRRAGADQPDVIQERAAEGRVEEVIGHGVLLGELAFRHIGSIVVTHRQAAIIAPGHKLVHLAAVDLILLLIEAVDQVADLLIGRHITGDRKGLHRHIRREARIGTSRLQIGVDRLRQRCEWLAVLIDLFERSAGFGDAIRAGELTVQTVEAPVFLIEDDNMVDRIRRLRLGGDAETNREQNEGEYEGKPGDAGHRRPPYYKPAYYIRTIFYATLFRRNHPIAQHADMVDLGLHYVAGLHILRRIEAHAHAAGRAGRDHRARLERLAERQHLDRRRNVEDQVADGRVLAGFAVQSQPQSQSRRVGYFVGSDDPWADRAAAIEALAFVELLMAILQVARRNIVENCIAEDILHRLSARDILPAAPDDIRQLDFVIQRLCHARVERDVVVWPTYARGGLGKKHRVWRQARL